MATRKAESGVTEPIGTLIADSLLPGDGVVAPDQLREVARFLGQAARLRRPGEAVVQVDSLAANPGTPRRTRIALVNDDMPFLVDSIANTVAGLGLSVERLVHPVARVERSAAGDLLSLAPANGGEGDRESLVYVETARADARTRARLRSGLESTLADVRAAVADWTPMRAAIAADADHLEACGATEDAALLRWLAQDMLTQLAHVTHRRGGSRSECLGLCRTSERGLLSAASYARAFE